jgi:hypothetical protein
MSLPAKRESLTRIHGRYERAGRPHKTRILEEFCAICGYHRKAALQQLLKAALPEWLEHHERRTTPLPEAFSPTSATGAGDGFGVVDHNYAAVGNSRRLPAPAVPSNDFGSHGIAQPTRSLTLRLTRKCGF